MSRNAAAILISLVSIFYAAGSRAQENDNNPVEFTGSFNESGFDMDGNGLFEHLKFEVELRAGKPCDVAFMANLSTAEGKPIAFGTLRPEIRVSALFTSASLKEGVQTIPIYFLGRNIMESGFDGPYTVNITLIGEGGRSLGEAEFTTQKYSYKDFQGLLAQIRSIKDMGLDTDSVPGYNLLRIEAEIEMLASGDLDFMCQLFSKDLYLTSSPHTKKRLEKGIHKLIIDLPGEAVTGLSVNGPYTIYLNLNDDYYNLNETYTTQPYKYTEFQRP